MKTDKIVLEHGSGGKMSHRLVTDLMLPIFDNPVFTKKTLAKKL
jgi:hydrogenase expression/formation protein HypE